MISADLLKKQKWKVQCICKQYSSHSTVLRPLRRGNLEAQILLCLNKNLSFTSHNLLRLKVINKALFAAVLLFSKIHFFNHRAQKYDCCGGEQ